MPRPGPGFVVRLPGLEDSFHLIPETARPESERRRRARERAERLRDSPTPEIVRGVQDLLTRIDDIQDGLVTLALISRFAVSRIPGLAPAAKVLAVGADVLNLANFSILAGLIGGSRKGALYRALAASPRTYSQRLRSTLRTNAVNPGWGELLQVLQTTDSLLGVGLSLGAIIGLPVDLAFLALRGGTLEIPVNSLLDLAVFAPTFFAASPWFRAISLAAGFALSALERPELPTLTIPFPSLLPIAEEYFGSFSRPAWSIPSIYALESAEEILELTPLLDVLDQDLSTEDHFMITMARYMALATLAPIVVATEKGAIIREKIPFPVRARFPMNASTAAAVNRLSPPGGAPPALALPGSPVELTAGELPDALRAAGAPGPLAWTLRDPHHPMSIYAASLAGEAMNVLALMLEGPGSISRPVYLPEARAAALAIETGRRVPV